MDPLSLLKSTPGFEDLSPASYETLAGACRVKTCVPGEPIIRFGEKGTLFGVVAEGEVEAVRTDPDGTEDRQAVLGRGEYFGEMSLMTGEPTTADVVAYSPAKVLLLPHASLHEVLVKEPRLATSLASTISKRLVNREKDRRERDAVAEARRAEPDPYGLKQFPLRKGGRVLTVNCGSSSLKYRLFDSADPAGGLAGSVERIGLEGMEHVSQGASGPTTVPLAGAGHGAAFEAMMEAIEASVPLDGIDVVGHRVVHGGEKHGQAVVVDDGVMRSLKACEKFAPLHMPANLAGIEEARRRMPRTPQVAVFDTGFHRTIPKPAYLYGLPYAWYEEAGVRRYGFHGMSHKYIAYKTATVLRRPLNELKLITCHLGNGASLAAIDHGRCVDTSMGMTPLEGLIMGTRTGDVDPGALLFLMKAYDLPPGKMESMLNRESGLKGLSGVSSDMREVLEEAKRGNDRALTAVQAFCYRVKKYIGAFWAALGGLDALVFTGGIGEKSPEIRARVCQGLSKIGVVLDEEKNRTPPGRREVPDISAEWTPLPVLVLATDEERMIAREAARALEREGYTQLMRARDREIPVGVSAHHVHLSPAHVEALFGKGHTLTFKSPLSQPGQFACEERVNLVGPKGRVERLRVLGPERPASQVEIARTEEFKLGIDAPIRLSGDLEGTPGLVLEGPKGRVTLDRGVICALRHIHMTPEDALGFGLKDRDVVQVRVAGERGLIFDEVVVRVKPSFQLEFHLDTDEANAGELSSGVQARLFRVESRR